MEVSQGRRMQPTKVLGLSAGFFEGLAAPTSTIHALASDNYGTFLISELLRENSRGQEATAQEKERF
jgi:hypothetical protein